MVKISNSKQRASGKRRKLLVLIIIVTLVLLSHSMSSAQTIHDFGSWFSINTQGKFARAAEDSNLRWWFDGHLRYLDDADGFNQSIFRPAFGYQINPNTNVWFGYAWINENPTSGNPLFDENRIWQQLLWSKKFGSEKWFSRTRFEQRFVETGDDLGLRLRQFVKVDRPFCEDSPYSFVVWDEGFLDLNSTDWGQQGTFSQNRLFIGFGRKFSGPSSPKIEIGYLNQYIRRRSADDRFNHILSVNWFRNF